MNPLSRVVNAIADRLAPAEAKASDAVEHLGDDIPPLGAQTTKPQATGETQAAARVPKEKIAEKGESLSQKAAKWGNRAKGAALFALGKVVSGAVAFGGAVRGLADRREIHPHDASKEDTTQYYQLMEDLRSLNEQNERCYDKFGEPLFPGALDGEIKKKEKELDALEAKMAKEQGIGVRGKMAEAAESNAGIIGKALQDMGRACFSKIGKE